MTMTVRYNGSANRALSHTDKNDKARSKALGKIASGMKINSAGDDAASFSIGSKMRVKLRALEQDTQNVQNGSAILRTAEGGIQGQIDLIRTIREKVIDAANDPNTEDDRKTIQKELYHLYTQMENIAYETDYNSKKPLLANDRISTDGELSEISRTALNIIPDNYPRLDSANGPFDIFAEYSVETTNLGTTSGYVAGTSKVMSVDFSGYSDVGDLNNVGVRIGSSVYVLTNDTSKNYRNAAGKINISDCTDVSDVINKFKNYFGGTIDGTKVNLSASNITGASDAGGTVTTNVSVPHAGTGAGIRGTTSGGVTNLTGDTDLPAAAKATLTVDLSGVTSNTGFRFNGVNFRVLDSGATAEGTVDRTLTKGSDSSGTAGAFSYTFDGSELTFTANSNGEDYNNVSIVNAYTYYTTEPKTTEYTAYTAFTGATATVADGTSATPGSWNFDLSGMTVDDFSAAYAGKSLQVFGSVYKLYDSSLAPKLEGFPEDSGSRTVARTHININDIRQAVADGQTLAEAVRAKLGGTVDGDSVRFTANSNSAQINLITENLRHYDIDFSNLGVKMPDDLYGKGFRAYCATDNKEWFNFVFTDGTDSYDTDKDNIKSIAIDVSAVTNTEELVQAIYDQANPILTGNDPKFNHHLRLAADNNTLTIYDHRRFDVSQAPYAYQEMGAKIADGVSFTEEEETPEKNLLVKDLVIQHTDKAGMNIRIKIPQMTLDQIFDPLPVTPTTIFDYPVTDKASRNYLLGNPNPPGILDNGLQYLLDAVTLVGAQNRRLEFTAENITTEIENLTASESVISDADMAKKMTEYTKYNILTQASQAMLAQANQSQSMILSLLE